MALTYEQAQAQINELNRKKDDIAKQIETFNASKIAPGSNIVGSNPGRVQEEYNNAIARAKEAGYTDFSRITTNVAPIGGNSGRAATPEERMGAIGKYTSVGDYYPSGASIPQSVISQAQAAGNVTIPSTLTSGNMSGGTQTNFGTNPTPGTNTYPPTDISTDGLSETEKISQNMRNELININNSLSGQGAFRQQQEDATGLAALEQSKRDFTAQLKTLENERKDIQTAPAAPNQTAAMLGAQQNEMLRQNSIKSWGVAASLDAANGNIQAAYDKVDKLVEAKYGDAERRSKILKDNLDIIENSPAYKASERKQAAALKAQTDKEDDARKVSMDITDRIGKLMLDDNFIKRAPQSLKRELGEMRDKQIPLTESDWTKVLNKAAQYTVAPEVSKTPEAPTVKSINGVDMQWNPKSGKWENIAGTGGVGQQSPYQEERQFRTIQSVDELGIKARSNPGIFGRTAALPLPDFVRTDAFRDFRSELDTLKASITFGELTAMREASKTGGALGQVSDKENQLLGAALGALNMSQTPDNFNKQLSKIKASIQRWQKAVSQNSGQTSTGSQPTITAPDGTEIIIID